MAALIGTAKPIDWASSEISVLRPITWPQRSTRGPPELPGLMGASVWIIGSSEIPGSVRLRPLTIPRVIVWSRPMGLPMATTSSPTLMPDESPSLAAGQRARRLHPQQRQVEHRVEAHHPRRDLGAAVERHRQGGRAVHDVGVGEDLAVLVDDDAGAHDRLESPLGLGLVDLGGLDRDDGRRHALEQHGQRLGARLGSPWPAATTGAARTTSAWPLPPLLASQGYRASFL